MPPMTSTKTPIISPLYVQVEPNQPIELGQVSMEFAHAGIVYPGLVDVRMRFTPSDRLEFVWPLDGMSAFFGLKLLGDEQSNYNLKLVETGVPIRVDLAAQRGNKLIFVPTSSGVTVTPPATSIATATCHLLNVPDFAGPEDYILLGGDTPEEGLQRCGRVPLEADGWRITIAATGDTNELVKKLKAQGGYLLTHVAKIERKNSESFTSEALDEILTCFHYFLSFALGRWAGVALTCGFDSEGKMVHQEWGLRRTADGPWNGSLAWFDEHHSELLPQIFPGFMALWRNQVWREPLTHALYWYLGACDRGVGVGVDTGLILAQTALEGLAWTYCVTDRKMVSGGAFGRRGLSAADKMRLLLSSLNIPLQIPASMLALLAKRGQPWVDGTDAITAIRNSLVHAGSHAELPHNSYYEAWNLSLWYIDLVLLRLCGHNGEYANRLVENRWVGQAQRVPWALESGTNINDMHDA